MIKWSIQQEDITFINIYEPNIKAPKYIWQVLYKICTTDIKGIYCNIIINTLGLNTGNACYLDLQNEERRNLRKVE